MRTAILSDIHGNDVAFQAVLDHMKSNSVNCVVFLGDLVAKGPEPQACFDRMKDLKPLVWLKGNTETWLDDALINVIPSNEANIRLLNYYDYLSHNMTGQAMDELISLPYKAATHFGHFEGLCVHGTPRDPEEILNPHDEGDHLYDILKGITSPLILCGHSHIQFNEVYHSYRLINPGSVGMGLGAQDPRAYYSIIDTSRGFQIEHYQLSYDYSRLIAVAKATGFPEYESYKEYFMGK